MTTTSHDEPPAEEQCACGHPLAEHDALASRYCQATIRGGLDRGCMCTSVATSARNYGVGR
ncbi:MAG TPA: RGCVC family protein [Polyangia bacterium]|nr:RGCVC family protein [Polyangia bacterium]